jgi:O-methyltransferase involved in polyketide biosynthesis
MYLTTETGMETMKQIASLIPSGNKIVFDYLIPPSSQDLFRQLVLRLLAYRLEVVGKSW